MTKPAGSSGFVEVMTGPMFSSKTEELHRRLNRSAIGKRKTCLLTADGRHVGGLTTHGVPVLRPDVTVFWTKAPDFVLRMKGDALEAFQTIGIDEAQFLDESYLCGVIETLRWGRTILVAGLDLDFRGEPFAGMMMAMARADSVKKLSAVCVDCGGSATISHRLVASTERVLEGMEESYAPLCRACHARRGGILPIAPPVDTSVVPGNPDRR